jgi:rRNA-processing protein FCF1
MERGDLSGEMTPMEEILQRVSNNPDIAIQQVILDELNRMHRRIMQLEGEVATLKRSIKN